MQRLLLIADLAVKILAVALVLVPLVDPGLSQYTGKAVSVRAVLWPLLALFVPAWWLAAGRPRPYPFVADILIVIPFLLDAAGNLLGLVAQPGFDVIPHVAGGFCLAVFFGLAVAPVVRRPWVVVALCTGFGATLAILWEVGEFLLRQTGSSGLQLTYENTIQDLATGLLGSVAGGIAVTLFARPRPETPANPFGWTHD